MTTDDERAAQLLNVATDLITRVRDDDPRAVQRHLATLPPADLRDVAVLLAAMVPDDRTPAQLLAWYTSRPGSTSPEPGRPTPHTRSTRVDH